MKKGLMVVISGPAGCGKGTIRDLLMGMAEFKFSVSDTTRAPRPGEVDGREYSFITAEAFRQKISAGEMLEYTTYCGNLYGTPRKAAMEIIDRGDDLLLEIEVEGAANVKKAYPDAVLIMILPPSHKVQEQRLRGRATETEDKILERLARAKSEIYEAPNYDYVVYNLDGKADEAAKEILNILKTERAAMKRNPDVIKKFLED